MYSVTLRILYIYRQTKIHQTILYRIIRDYVHHQSEWIIYHSWPKMIINVIKKKFVYYITFKNHPLQHFICSRTHLGQSIFIWSPWTMNPFLTLWKMLPAYPNPFSPVDSCTKFFTVTGTVCPNKPNSILPTASPPIATSKYTMSVTTVSPAVSLAWNGEK